MFSKQGKQGKNESTKLSLKFFDLQNQSDIDALNAFIDNEIAQKDEKNKPLNATHQKMVAWLIKYVNSYDFMKMYHDTRSIEAIAEATFWSVQLGLEPHLAKMSYAEIRKFQPLQERTFENTERSKLIKDVCAKLMKPAMSHEASYALGQAAWAVYVHHNSFAKMQEEGDAYDSGQTSQFGSNL
jgi:hypothetical protein